MLSLYNSKYSKRLFVGPSCFSLYYSIAVKISSEFGTLVSNSDLKGCWSLLIVVKEYKNCTILIYYILVNQTINGVPNDFSECRTKIKPREFMRYYSVSFSIHLTFYWYIYNSIKEAGSIGRNNNAPRESNGLHVAFTCFLIIITTSGWLLINYWPGKFLKEELWWCLAFLNDGALMALVSP